MSVLTKARTDWKSLSQRAFDLEIRLVSPDGDQAIVKGLAAETNVQFDLDGDGIPTNDNDAHFSFVESNLIEANATYPIRDANGEVDLQKHKVAFPDANGTLKAYTIKEAHPDQTVGVIFCRLSNFDPSVDTTEIFNF